VPVVELWSHVQAHPLWAYRQQVQVGFFLCLLLEMSVLAVRFRESYRPALMLSTTAMWLVEQGGRLLMYPFRLAVFVAVAQAVFVARPQPNVSGLWTWIGAYLCVDFLYYWKHRWLHRFEWTWALHSVHHSTDDLNLMAAVRLGWVQRWIDDFFYLPLVLLGFDPVVVLLTVEINHASQFWCHTRVIGTLGPLDALINTPSNHRVHHAATRALSDHNFGSTLMCWDRWFGSYLKEPEGGVRSFGLETGPTGVNPLRIQLAPLWRYLRGLSSPGDSIER